MRRVAIVFFIAINCAKPQPAADSTSAAEVPSPSDTARRADTAAVAARDPIQEQATPIQTGGKAPRPTGEVIVGRVAEHGADPITFIAITAGGTQTRVSGGQLGLLSAVQGTEVWARGRRDGSTFIVDTFEVRRANDQAVEDGIVSVSGTTAIVRTARGEVRYPNAPTDLRNAVGARVWITPPIAGQAPSFAVIRLRS